MLEVLFWMVAIAAAVAFIVTLVTGEPIFGIMLGTFWPVALPVITMSAIVCLAAAAAAWLRGRTA